MTEPIAPSREPAQRWRITYRREPVSPDRVGRAAVDEWHAALAASGLAVAPLPADPGRPRLAFAAPLPANAAGEAELVDVWLLDRVPRWRLRDALVLRLPANHRWIDAEDIWLGGPPLAGQVVAADWRIEVSSDATPVDVDRLRRAANELLAARSIERTRAKGTTQRRYDLRPLVEGIEVDSGERVSLLVRTRFDPERGAGRPDEVVAALAEIASAPMTIQVLTRTRLVLATDTR